MSKSQSPVPGKKAVKAQIELSFYDALASLVKGVKIRRLEWTDKNEYGILKDGFLMIHRNDKFHNWIVSEGDMSAKDWVIINEGN